MKDPQYVEAMQNLRRSNAAAPIPSGKKYRRRARSQKADVRNND